METKTTNGWAIASFVCGIVGLFGFAILLGPLAIVFSNKALKTMKENENGKGLEEAGWFLGWVQIGMIISLVIILLFFDGTALASAFIGGTGL